MRNATRLLTATALVATIWVPAAGAAPGDCRLIRGAETPEDPADDVSVCRQDNWIHQATTKAGNLAGFGADILPSWNTTKPTASVTSGAGGGYLTNSTFHQLVAPQDPRGSAVFQGTYTGTLDNVAVELYAFVPPIFTRDLNIALTIDDEPVFASNAVVNMSAGGNAVQKLSFAFTNVYRALELAGKQGDATTAHTIRLAVNGRYIVNDPALFVYDTSEVPSGLIFNLETTGLSPYTVIDLAPPES